jgi:hypothetical protein
MRKIYFNIFIGIIILLWIVYFIRNIFSKDVSEDISEGFTPRIHALYRPYVRHFNQHYEYFTNEYGINTITNKLRKWNIY